jgi:hypothetical protein
VNLLEPWPANIDWSEVEAVGRHGWLSPRQFAHAGEVINAQLAAVDFGPIVTWTIPWVAAGPPYNQMDLGALGVFAFTNPGDAFDRFLHLLGEDEFDPPAPRLASQVVLTRARAFLDAQDEWHFDRTTRELRVVLCEAYNPNVDIVTAPVLERLLVLDQASHLEFRWLDFAYTHLPFPKQPDGLTAGFAAGGSGRQWIRTSHHSRKPDLLGGAVVLEGAFSCRFFHCRIGHTGGTGVWIGSRRAINPANPNPTHPSHYWYFESHFNQIERCEIFDTGGHGLWLGDHHLDLINWQTQLTTAAEPNEFNDVRDSKIHRYGQAYSEAAGLFVPAARNALILNNEVAYGGWAGIAVGDILRHETDVAASGCGPFPRTAEGTRVEHNLVYRVCLNTVDCGGIYSQGNHQVSPEAQVSTMHGNYVRNMQPDGTFNVNNFQIHGMYFDFGSAYWHITRNYVANTWRIFHFHQRAANPPSEPCPDPGTGPNAPFAGPAGVKNFTMTCPTNLAVRTFAGQNWYSQTTPVDLRNRWFKAPTGPNWQQWYYTKFTPYEHSLGQCLLGQHFPNSFVFVQSYQDPAAQAIAAEAGPAQSAAWFPYTGERIYPLQRRCALRCSGPPPEAPSELEDPGSEDDLTEVFWP